MTADDLSLAIEKKSEGQAGFFQTVRYDAPLVIEGRKIFPVQFREKRPNHFRPPMIDRNGQHGDALRCQGWNKRGKGGDLLNARAAPCRPKMHDCGSATKIAQRVLDSVSIGYGLAGERLRERSRQLRQ